MANTRHSCNFYGKCEPDEEGRYPNDDSCKQACYARPLRDMNYIVQTMNPQPEYLAPSDAVQVIFRLTGIKVPITEAKNVLKLIVDEKYVLLGKRGKEWVEWISEDPFRLLLLRLNTLNIYRNTVRSGYAMALNELPTNTVRPNAEHTGDSFAATFGVNEYPPNMKNFFNSLLDMDIGFDTVSITTSDGRNLDFTGANYDDLLGVIQGLERNNQTLNKISSDENGGILVSFRAAPVFL